MPDASVPRPFVDLAVLSRAFDALRESAIDQLSHPVSPPNAGRAAHLGVIAGTAGVMSQQAAAMERAFARLVLDLALALDDAQPEREHAPAE